MVFVNYTTRQIAIKIVYYGPGLSGKTTNLQYIYQKTNKKIRGELISLETETERTLFFDLLPMEMGEIMGFHTKLQLYTVPGQVHYSSTRKLVLKGVDGIVFVADSQAPLLEANKESLDGMIENLKHYGLSVEEIPLVFQYNKRDLPNVLPIQTLENELNKWKKPYFEASAIKGIGVFETLKAISKMTLLHVKDILEGGAEEEKPAPTIISVSDEEKVEKEKIRILREKETKERVKFVGDKPKSVKIKKIELESNEDLKKELNHIAVESTYKAEKNKIEKNLLINVPKEKLNETDYFWISFLDDSGKSIKKFKISKEKVKNGAILNLNIDINVK